MKHFVIILACWLICSVVAYIAIKKLNSGPWTRGDRAIGLAIAILGPVAFLFLLPEIALCIQWNFSFSRLLRKLHVIGDEPASW